MKRVIEYIKSNPGMMLAILACAIILFTTRGMLAEEDLEQSGDLNYHLACETEVATAIKEGRSPFGPISLNFGTPILKFYQPLLYLVTGYVHFITRVDVLLLHNLLIVFLFALTPFCLRWCYVGLGLREVTSGAAALMTLMSVGGFANSYKAYFSLGIISQLLGAVFFPLFIGAFARMLRDGRGSVRATVLFALAFVAHVMMAVYAVFAGGLLFVTNRWDLKRIWKLLIVFGVLAGLLVAFWFVPFVTLRDRFRPVPDVVALPSDAHFNAGLTAKQATKLLFTGRLLDDARHKAIDPDRTEDDILIDKINMLGTYELRPPVVTILALMGLLLCLFRYKSEGYRFLIAGFFFSFLLIMGPDDVPWIRYLPFAKRIQFFRCTYLLEFFAFGLAAAGLEIAFSFLARAARRLPLVGKRAVGVTAGLLIVAALAYHLFLVHGIATQHVNPKPKKRFDRVARVARPALDHFPARMILNHGHFRSDKRRMTYLTYKGNRTVCGHWRVMGATIANDLCRPLFHPGANLLATRRTGIGLFLVNRKLAEKLNDVSDGNEKPLEQINRGGGHYLYRDMDMEYLWAAPSAALVLADNVQWFHVTRAWIAKLGRRRQPESVTPVRLSERDKITGELLRAFDAVWILDMSQIDDAEIEQIAAFEKSGGHVLSVEDVPGVEETIVLPEGEHLVKVLAKDHVDVPVGFEKITAGIGGPFEYRVESTRSRVVILPEFVVPGWDVTIDGSIRPTLAAGPDFVATVVPKGTHTIVFEWNTPGLELISLAVSGVAWLGVVVFGVLGVFRRRKRK